MSKKAHTLYRIWYGDKLVYLGRTNQKLQDRLRGHFFGRPMHRKLNLEYVTKIEYVEFETEADMFVYEVYFINFYKPFLNVDDRSSSELTVRLPEVEWVEFVSPRLEKWREEIKERDAKYEQHQKEANDLFLKLSIDRNSYTREQAFELRKKAEELRKVSW